MKKYVSSIANLGITITPGRPIYEAGQRVGDVPGKHAKFVSGVFETADQEIIDKLESLPTFGRDFYLADETAPVVSTPEGEGENLSSLTVPQLKAKAKEQGIEVPNGTNKEGIIKLLASTPEGEGEDEEDKEDEDIK